jgi:hypothetical protein
VARNNDDRLHEVAELPHDAEIDAFINVAKRLERERDAKQQAAALAHPKEPLLRNSPEVSSTAENMQPNQFDNTLLLADEVGNNKEEMLAESGARPDPAPATLPTVAGDEGAAAARQEPRPPADPAPPTGYVRRGDRCYPFPGYMHRKESGGGYDHLPGSPTRLPAAYYLDDYLHEWIPVSSGW